jgi:hypothetical protein
MMRLPLSLTELQLAALTVEAAHPGTEEWQQLRRYRPELARDLPDAAASAVSIKAAELVGRGEQKSIPPAVRITPDRAVVDFWTDSAGRQQIADDGAYPVFVVGAPRSGTTALFAALTGTTRYSGFGEGHVLDIAARLNAEIRAHIAYKYRIQSAEAVAQCHLARDPDTRLRSGLHLLLRLAADGYTTRYWIDKTPSREMVQSVPILAETWPNARFVYMKRRGIENLMSRLRKFPGVSFQAQCLDWAAIMSDWRKVRTSIVGKFVEIEQRSLLHDPGAAAAMVGALIGLDGAEIAALGARLSGERAETTDQTASIIADIAETGWSAAMIESFRAICGLEMRAYGYAWDASYCAPPPDRLGTDLTPKDARAGTRGCDSDARHGTPA